MAALTAPAHENGHESCCDADDKKNNELSVLVSLTTPRVHSFPALGQELLKSPTRHYLVSRMFEQKQGKDWNGHPDAECLAIPTAIDCASQTTGCSKVRCDRHDKDAPAWRISGPDDASERHHNHRHEQPDHPKLPRLVS